MAWAIFWYSILYVLLPLGAGLYLTVGFSSFSLLFYSFHSFATISCCTTLSFMWWCYFTQACWASLGLLLILLAMTQYGHWIHTRATLDFFITLLVGSFVQFISSWASLALFLILYSHGLLLTPLGFLSLITLSFILGAHGLSINPLLSLLALLRACCGPFSFFYITCCPWVCYFSLWALLGPFAFSRLICLFYGPMIYYFCHLGLMIFLSTH